MNLDSCSLEVENVDTIEEDENGEINIDGEGICMVECFHE